MEQEKWINSVLNSTNGITKVVPDDILLSRIQEKINAKNVVPFKIVWAVAASITLLLSTNLYLLISSAEKQETTSTVLAFGLNKSNQLYTIYE